MPLNTLRKIFINKKISKKLIIYSFNFLKSLIFIMANMVILKILINFKKTNFKKFNNYLTSIPLILNLGMNKTFFIKLHKIIFVRTD